MNLTAETNYGNPLLFITSHVNLTSFVVNNPLLFIISLASFSSCLHYVLLENFTNAEFTAVHFMYGRAFGNSMLL